MSRSCGPSVTIQSSAEAANDTQIIGPALPPHLLNKSPNQNHSRSLIPTEDQNKIESEQCKPTDTKSVVIGPTLPPYLLNKANSNEDSSDDSCNMPEPSLPEEDTDGDSQNLLTCPDAYGPSLPPHLKVSSETNRNDCDDDDDVYGPLPPGISASSHAQRLLEERALQIKLGHIGSSEDKGTVREEWMTELPDVRSATSLGLGPRQFRKNERPDFSDRSSWTDTPEQKAKKSHRKSDTKIDLKKEAELRAIRKRDEEQAKMAEKHNKKKKRDKSLLQMHQDDQKKKKKKDDEEGPSRRPFSREIDLQANRLDDAQKKSIMKKAMLLDDRFSRGQSKFL